LLADVVTGETTEVLEEDVLAIEVVEFDNDDVLVEVNDEVVLSIIVVYAAEWV
jgi:hypothetical protein